MNALFALMAIVNVNEEHFARENFVYCTAIIIIEHACATWGVVFYSVIVYTHACDDNCPGQ